jgi:acyl-CoA thioester hydrolase
MDKPYTKSNYTFFTEVMLRFGDLDVAGHVNNAVFATLFENARCELLLNGTEWIAPEGQGFVMRRLELDFLKPLRFPQARSVSVGSAITAIGDSSATFQQALFVDDECHALAKSVMVLISAKGKEPLPDSVRQWLLKYSAR